MATATEVPERLSARREHFTSGEAPSSASAITDAARITKSERSSRRARRRAFGGVADEPHRSERMLLGALAAQAMRDVRRGHQDGDPEREERQERHRIASMMVRTAETGS